jgi:preprotein translocase subunit SecA
MANDVLKTDLMKNQIAEVVNKVDMHSLSKAIYSFRNQLLDPEFDIGSKIKENRETFINMLLTEAEIYEGTPSEDFDLEKFTELIKKHIEIDIDTALLGDKEPHEIREVVLDILEKAYEEKMSVFVPEQRQEIESMLHLQILDPLWRDHLYEMDVLKTGIGLRGYNQKDPLTEYKQESYRLFEQLVERIKFDATKILYNIQFNFEAPDEELEEIERMRDELEIDESELVDNIHQEETSSNESGHTPYVADKKPKRNEPCPCGSGKKYKHCCGRSGPKKGLLA